MPSACARLRVATLALLVTGTCLQAGKPKAPALGPPLDPRFLRLGAAIGPEAKADWQVRLAAREGGPSLVPLDDRDPGLPLVLVFPGNGMNFQDLHGIARIGDRFRFLTAIADHRKPLHRLASAMADTLEEADLPALAGSSPPGLRVVGHSFGVPLALLTLSELARRGRLGPGGLGAVTFVAVEGPWRGADLPFFLTWPGVKQVAGGAATLVGKLVAGHRLNPGSLSVVNRTRSMREAARVELGPWVATELAMAAGPMDTSPRLRHLEPVAGWLASELGTGELELLWRYYRSDSRDPGTLESWAVPLVRKLGLRALVASLALDRDYPAVEPHLVEAARACDSPEDFAVRWDALLPRVVEVFSGRHTEFMWEDPRFLPWLADRLAAPLPGPPAGEPDPG